LRIDYLDLVLPNNKKSSGLLPTLQISGRKIVSTKGVKTAISTFSANNLPLRLHNPDHPIILPFQPPPKEKKTSILPSQPPQKKGEISAAPTFASQILRAKVCRIGSMPQVFWSQLGRSTNKPI
jgi:hypothetical protein